MPNAVIRKLFKNPLFESVLNRYKRRLIGLGPAVIALETSSLSTSLSPLILFACVNEDSATPTENMYLRTLLHELRERDQNILLFVCGHRVVVVRFENRVYLMTRSQIEENYNIIEERRTQ